MKKYFAVVVALLMCLAIFAACDSKEDDESKESVMIDTKKMGFVFVGAFDNLMEWFRLVLKTRDRRCEEKKSRSTPPPPRCFWCRQSTDVCFL